MTRISTRPTRLLSTTRGELFLPQNTDDFSPCRPVVNGLDKNRVSAEFQGYVADSPGMQAATNVQLEALARVNRHANAARKLITCHLQELGLLTYNVASIDVARVNGHFVVEASPDEETHTKIMNSAVNLARVLGFSVPDDEPSTPSVVTLTNPMQSSDVAEYVVEALRDSLIPSGILTLGPLPATPAAGSVK